MRWLYSAFLWLMQPRLRARLLRRGTHEPGYLHAVEERFGRYTMPPGQGYVWVHAVSLGETRAAAILVEQLRQRLPGMRLLLTHGTATGRAEGLKLLQPGDVQAWLPWDLPGAVGRFLAHFGPRIGLLMETEVWPNLAAACRARGVPLVLANARLSESSLRKARGLAWLSRPAYRALAAVWAQTEADAQRLRALGAPVQGVFGNLKFDAEPEAAPLARGRAWRAAAGRPVVMFASSREGEEASLFEVLKRFRADVQVQRSLSAIESGASGVQWLVVPRHPQRFDEVAALAQQQGFSVSRRSAWGDAPPAPADLWLGDSLGEMGLYYGLSDVALLGGSFAPLGGQNLIEAAACGCPVIMGPHTFNFTQAAELAEEAGAALRVADLAAAVPAAAQLAADAPRQAAAAARARQFAEAHRGAVHRTVQAVLGLLGAAGASGRR
ncbi:3-deoxy-D-manno-octulosonic acid transferase [Variovorax terrae]|uniref:3-deoxy-D-manno-octulosonic acid transferase n=1 Tax=Variovorax terrae TaxID=2923278 RepID=A0A9X1VUJ6_9BURK|nr:3-deoxy-D-manno-octulosonic acid transferase [Variovorax terrae]MCJ0762284.1 3-deoxy-D-manno-octulosonic acid transferase [Variovorax terrae]